MARITRLAFIYSWMPLHMTLVTGAIKSNLLEIRDRTTSKIVEKHQGKLTQQSIRPLQENGMAAISKILTRMLENFRLSMYEKSLEFVLAGGR